MSWHSYYIYIYIDYIYLRLIPVTPLKSDPWRWSVESGDVFVLQLLGWVFQESRSWNIPWSTSFKDSGSNIEKQEMLLVSTPFNFFFQIGNLPQIGINIKNIWNHHPVDLATPQKSMFFFLEKNGQVLDTLMIRTLEFLFHDCWWQARLGKWDKPSEWLVNASTFSNSFFFQASLPQSLPLINPHSGTLSRWTLWVPSSLKTYLSGSVIQETALCQNPALWSNIIKNLNQRQNH